MKRVDVFAFQLLLASLVLVGCTNDSAEKRLASARDFLQKNDAKSAVIEIKNALQKNPELGEARFLLGTTLLKDGNPAAAEVELRKALATNYSSDLVVPELARTMLLLGQHKKLIDEFGGTKLVNASAAAALQSALAGAYAAQGKQDLAKQALSSALAADPSYSPAVLINARLNAAAGDTAGALASLDGLLAKEPGNPDAWKLKGDILLVSEGKPDNALIAYRKALEIDPKFLPAHFAIMAVATRQGDLAASMKQLEELKAFAAKNPQTRYYEAELAYRNRDYKQSREIAQQLLQQLPNNPQILQIAGAAELVVGSLAQAEVYLSRALLLSPDLVPARRLLIATYLRSGQPAKALATLNAIPGKEGVGPAFYSIAGEVYLQNGDAKKAEEYFAKALKLDPENARKRTALAMTRLAGGRPEAAFDELETIAAVDSGVTADLALISAHLRRQEFDKALIAIDKLESKQPGKPDAANLRGRVLLAQKNNVAARKSFERALEIDADFFPAAASLGTMDVAEKRPEDARKRFEAMLARNPKNPQALLAVAQLAFATGAGKDEVAALLTKAIDANPTETAPRLMLIELLLRNKDNKQALAVAQAAATALPASPEVMAALGRTQLIVGENNQAIATYGKLAALQPLSPQAQVLLAEAQLANKERPAARQSLRRALELKADQLDAQRRLILLDIEDKNFASAAQIARTVQEQRPKEPTGLVLQGDVASAQRNWDAAARSYRSALQLRAAPETATKLHAVLLASGKAVDADKFAASWFKDHPKDVVFLVYMGELALGRKDYTAAEKYYLAALSLQPESALVLNNLAWVSGQLRKPGAIEYAERANKLAPNQPILMDTLATLLAEKGEYGPAIELQTRALALQPDNSALRLGLAKIYIKSGDKAKARGELESLAKLGSDQPWQAEVNALLKTL
jgi:putative PEP-CTERM system TPR-repeat lipoprotein